MDADKGIRFARYIFKLAGVYGIVVLLPQYFMEGRLARQFPPPITHPEHFYGFVGIALAWQVVFLAISADPLRYRPLMIAAILEKLAFGVPCLVLYAQGRLAGPILAAGIVDLVLGTLFLVSYRATSSAIRAGES